ncbi:hypothetical protein M407DRAFT_22733 [Tulasnella calospora MUT 4182]|uniref:Amino acid permease/ SLC12A domain-containing protein n=1 Tax=Tulasnella calospora MUT 4182 TaxID=1051891 RepID=A0A0C3M327_9AGAM|nr:hypothetical protein M407DRAFT_22733 [Tulasnella calospora MUT 4182]
MSSVVYGLVVSSAEMVSVYPYCRGTVGLADRFVDPALGFAMGWNAWFHWGIVIPSQIAAATSLIKYWHPSPQMSWAVPTVFIVLTSGSVFGARIYGELESVFAMIKLFAVVVLGECLGVAIMFDSKDVAHNRNPFRFWNPPFAQYLDIPGAKGRFLGFCAVFVQAAISFFGTEIPSIIAGELKDAPRVIYPVAKRLWIRLSIIYFVAVFVAGTLVPREVLQAQMEHINPDDPNSPENDAPWASSPFLTALHRAGSSYNWIANLCIACFITSAASAASTEVFLSARYLYFLAKAGHAPAFFGAVWPDTQEARRKGAVVPWVGVLTTVAFATMSWLCVRPGENTESEMEKTFLQIESMTTSACLQAWVGTLFTYIRFWWGTRHPKNRRDYGKEIERIKENRAWGQPFWATYSFTVCSAILIFNGWSLFNQKNAVWVIYYSGEQSGFSNDQVLKFITTYAPIPIFILALFGYKLICQTTMRRAMDMNFSGVAYPEGSTPVEVKPESLWGRVWWTLVK